LERRWANFTAFSSESLWDCHPQVLVRKLESSIKLYDAYREQYSHTKTKLGELAFKAYNNLDYNFTNDRSSLRTNAQIEAIYFQ
jgi:hypothetical protein